MLPLHHSGWYDNTSTPYAGFPTGTGGSSNFDGGLESIHEGSLGGLKQPP